MFKVAHLLNSQKGFFNSILTTVTKTFDNIEQSPGRSMVTVHLMQGYPNHHVCMRAWHKKVLYGYHKFSKCCVHILCAVVPSKNVLSDTSMRLLMATEA